MRFYDDRRESHATDFVQHLVGLSTDKLPFYICFGETAIRKETRKETSKETLELIGLLSDKPVGKPNSCQLPSGSKETRKVPHGHKF